jgi:hypothetical protein
LLKVVAATHGETGGHPSSLLSGPVESMIAAPRGTGVRIRPQQAACGFAAIQ